MSAVEDLCNKALSHLRGDNVATINVGIDGERCQEWYETAVTRCLREYDWGFARGREALVEHADDPPDQWLFRYTYPACVRVLRIWNPAGENAAPVPYSRELNDAKTAKTIVTNQPDAIAICTYRVAEALFPPEFVEATSYLLAHYVAFDITGKIVIKDKMLQYYENKAARGAATDANEDKSENETRDAEWVEGRI